jgi:hypothetical protein
MIGSAMKAAIVSAPSRSMIASISAIIRSQNAASLSPASAKRYQCGQLVWMMPSIGRSNAL